MAGKETPTATDKLVNNWKLKFPSRKQGDENCVVRKNKFSVKEKIPLKQIKIQN